MFLMDSATCTGWDLVLSTPVPRVLADSRRACLLTPCPPRGIILAFLIRHIRLDSNDHVHLSVPSRT